MESNSVFSHTSDKQNLFITKMIKDIIGLNEALLTINHNYNKMGNVLALLKIKKRKKFQKNTFKCARAGWRELSTVLLHCPITSKIKTVDGQSDLRILL